MKNLLAAAALCLALPAHAAAPVKPTFSADGAFSLVPPARFALKPARDGGMSSAIGKYSMTFSYDIRTDAAHPGSCHGTSFPVSSRTASAYLKSWDSCEALSQRGGPKIRTIGKPVACYLGWQDSLEQLAKLVEPEIPD